MKRAMATIQDTRGLHLTPAARLVRCAQQFKSQILLCHDCKEANACSLLQVLTLGAAYGADVEITASGSDEREAIESIVELFRDGAGI
jgi:phosphocarrier protein HPr